jgi:uncharacterized coiled-coil DUF342 family protein
MEQSQQSLMSQQINRVSRRLAAQLFVARLTWCWAAALAAAAMWFLLEPVLLAEPPDWLRWSVAGGLVGIATGVAGLLTSLAAPSRVFAALSLDEQFGLKERVTTSLMLTPEQASSPAGQALLADVKQRIDRLDIPERFPVRLSWSAAAVPAFALLLAAVAIFYQPPQTIARATPEDELKKAPLNRTEIDQKFHQLKKKQRDRQPGDPPVSEKLKEIEAELDKIASKPRTTREELRQRLAEIQKVEDDVKDRQKQLLDKTRGLKNQLRQMDQQAQKSKDNPARDLEKALAKGDFAKAQDEAEKLMEKLRNNQLSDEDRQKLKDQIDQMKDKLDRLAKNKDREDELQKLAREGKLSKEALQKELDQIRQDNEQLKDLGELAKQLGECKNCLDKGDNQGAAEKLKGAGDKLKQLDLNEKEIDDLQDQLDRLQDARQAANRGERADQGKGDKGEGDKDGKDGDKDGKGQDGRGGKGDGKGDTDQPNDGGIGEGRRPVGKSQPYRSFEARQGTDFNPKGKKIFDGFADGPNFRSRTGPEIAGDVKQAAQEAPEAIEQQKIPKAARDIARGYFRNLGGENDKAPVRKNE